MSYYAQKIEEAKRTDFSGKRYLTDFEAAAYTSLGRTTFRAWAKRIGCRHKVGRRNLNDRYAIDEALKRGDEN